MLQELFCYLEDSQRFVGPDPTEDDDEAQYIRIELRRLEGQAGRQRFLVRGIQEYSQAVEYYNKAKLDQNIDLGILALDLLKVAEVDMKVRSCAVCAGVIVTLHFLRSLSGHCLTIMALGGQISTRDNY